AIDSFFGPPRELAQNDVRKGNIEAKPFEAGNPEKQGDAEEQLPESLLEPNNPQDPSATPDAANKGDADGDEAKKDKNGKDQDGKQGNQNQQDDKDKEEANNTENPGQQDSKGGGKPKNESLMDKVRDALANMLN